jgi:hypothetical protein
MIRWGDLTGPAGNTGTGARLMTAEGLPRDEHGHLYQITYWVDGDRKFMELVRDPEGNPLGWIPDNADGLHPYDWLLQQLPPEIVAVAEAWEAEKRAT